MNAMTPSQAAIEFTEPRHPASGSAGSEFTQTLLDQVSASLWVEHSDAKTRRNQIGAAIIAMGAMEPRDEVEGMLAALLIASHSAAMECHRRAMIGGQTIESRRDNLNQASKLSRNFVTLMDA